MALARNAIISEANYYLLEYNNKLIDKQVCNSLRVGNTERKVERGYCEDCNLCCKSIEPLTH